MTSRLKSGLTGRRSLILAGGLVIVLLAVLVAIFASDGDGASHKIEGAAALPQQPTPQETAPVLHPVPGKAAQDRGPIVDDGCMVGATGSESEECLYGTPKGQWTVVLFGDSHAMQYFPPLEKLAKKNNWRLFVLNKRECTPAKATVRSNKTGAANHLCDVWRRKEMRRIAGYGPHTTVVLGSDTDYTAYRHGSPLSGAAGADELQRGYEETLRALRRDGVGVVVVRNTPSSPVGIPRCVKHNRDRLKECTFPERHEPEVEFDQRAAQAIPGVILLDLTPEVCPDGTCRAVIGNALTYRDKHHLTATFAKSLKPWFATAMAEAGAPSRSGG
jgi:hypothetical protein